jgi:hypothetical protein
VPLKKSGAPETGRIGSREEKSPYTPRHGRFGFSDGFFFFFNEQTKCWMLST